MTKTTERLEARARALGVETSYQGVDRVWRRPSPRTLAAVVEVLEADRSPSDPAWDPEQGPDAGPAGSPPVMWRSTGLRGGVVLFCPTYALWSETDRDPSTAHLHALCRAARSRRVDVVATLPLHAAFLDEPYDPSPYAPVSRFHWNEAYIDPGRIPGASARPAEARPPGPRVEWRELAATRRRQLVDAVDVLDGPGGAALDAWLAANPDVTGYARFAAGRERRRGAPGPGRTDHPEARLVRSHELAQWLMDTGLQAVAADPAAASLGLDVPIGTHPSGYETWAHPEQFASGMRVGAPPDAFFRDGQNWGFPPLLPGAGRRDGHQLWRRVVERAGRHAALLRIDHVMGVHRLWWIPDGHDAAEGVYVRYPASEILAAVAQAAAAVNTTVVGENLGTVPPEVDDLLVRTATLGMHEEQFTMVAGAVPGPVSPDVVAGVRTHDMAPFALAAAEPASAAYAAALGLAPVEGAPVAPARLLDAVLARLGKGPAYLVAVDIDDLNGGILPHNVPGVHDPHGWSRRNPRPVDELLNDEEVVRRLELLVAARAEGGHR